MKIEYRKGNLFETDIRNIAHGCNAQGVMGSGVAKIVKEQYTEAYNQYKQAYESATDKFLSALPLGTIIPVESNGKVIINAITQRKFGSDGKRYVSYDAIADAMKNIHHWCVDQRYTEVAMPQIGAGLGGGDWTVIAAIIESELTDVQPVVYIL